MTRLNLDLMEQFWNLEAEGLVTAEGFEAYLRSLANTSPGWINDNGLINIKPLTSNGRNAGEWLNLLAMMRIARQDGSGHFFNCFKASEGVNYPISIITPSLFPAGGWITTEQVLAKASALKLNLPTEKSVIGEIAFLLSSFLSFQKMNDMGLDRIGILHQNPYEYRDNEHYLLCIEVDGSVHFRRKQLAVYRSHPGNKWDSDRVGFVFLR